MKITISHGNLSTGPAFLLDLKGRLSNALMLTSHDVESSDDLAVTSNSLLNNNLFSLQVAVLPIGGELNLTFMAIINVEDIDGNITDQVTVNYATIKQEGIGLEV